MRTLIFDIDDTVCESTKAASPDMILELTRLSKKSDIELVFISGSTVEDIYFQLKNLNAYFHIFGGSGTEYAIRHIDGRLEYIYREELSWNDRQIIIQALNDLIYRYCIETMTTREDQIQDRGTQITLSALGRNAPADIKRNFDPDGSIRHRWITYLKKEFPFLDEFSIRYGGTTSIDITKKNRDKMFGIAQYFEYNEGTLESSLYFGDKLDPGGNDHCVVGKILCVKVSSPTDTLSILTRLG